MSHLNKNTVIYNVEEIKSLVKEAKDGNHASFTKLYNAFFTPVYRYVFSRIHDKDVIQYNHTAPGLSWESWLLTA